MAFTVSSEIRKQSGVNEIAQASKRQQVKANHRTLDRQASALTARPLEHTHRLDEDNIVWQGVLWASTCDGNGRTFN